MKKLFTLFVFLAFAGSMSAQCNTNFSLYDSSGTIYGFNATTGAASTEWWVFDPSWNSTSYTSWDMIHTTSVAGTHTVCLYAYDSSGMWCDSTCQSINITTGSGSCTANFTSTPDTVSGGVYFTGSASGGSAPYSYFWDFGDGFNGTLTNEYHVYGASGTYTVCLTITDATGCTHTTCSNVTVTLGSSGCSNSFTVYPDSVPGSFYFVSSATGSAPISYGWDFGDGSSSTVANPYHVYATAGTYYACLLTWDATGCSDTTCTTITTSGSGGTGSACNADFVFVPDSSSGYWFWDVSTGSALNYYWDFGDGNTSSAANPYHAYAVAGTYNVCLTVWNSTGCADTTCNAITVTAGGTTPVCNADFIWFPDSSTNTVYLWNLASGGSGLTYFWDFGDGTTSNLEFPMHSYPSNGPYHVCLTVTDGACTSTFCDSVWIPLKASGFTINVVAPGGTTGIEDQSFMLTDGMVYPNPVEHNARLSFTSSTMLDATLVISSVDGKICSEKQINISSGENVINLNTEGLSNGLYMITISSDSRLGSYKFMKN